jgi:FkbM family methyltransferase
VKTSFEGKSFEVPYGYAYVDNINGCLSKGSVENKEMKAFLRETANCKCLIDVGSALGIFSLLFADDKRESYAIEPSHIQQPHYTQLYLANKDKKIYPQKMLVGDKTGIANFNSDDFHALSLPGNDKIVLMKIDDFCRMNNICPDVIKIDVEGYEISVLNGALQVIEAYRPIIFIEGHNKFLPGYGFQVNSLAEYPDSINYKIYSLDEKELTQLEYLNMLQEDTNFTHTYWLPRT